MKRILLNAGSVLLAASAAAAASSVSAVAQDEIMIEGNVALVTDYRFRGVTQSNEELAIQGGFDLGLPSGFYVGVWGSSIGFANGTELDLYGGYGFEASSLTFDVGALAYHYPEAPGGDSTTIFEVYGSVGRSFGMVDGTLGFAYIPEQDDTEFGGEKFDNTYVYLDGGVPLGESPFSLSGHVGYTDGSGLWDFSEDADGFWDWSLGVSTSAVGVDLGLTYIGTTETHPSFGLGEDQTVVFSVSKAF
jgi:uncharacterized protein (TIGR02001 family)